MTDVDAADRDDRVRVLLLGAGKVVVDQHLPALESLRGRLRLVGVCDLDAGRAAAVAGPSAAWSGTDLDEALRVLRPDLVLVATPPDARADVVPRCLRAGAWVVCEKPPARSLAELDVIAAAEADSGNPCSFIFQQRFGATAQHLRQLVDDGTTGPLLAVTAQTLWFRDAAYYAAPWRGTWASEGGGTLLTLGIHVLDLALWLAGGWTEVTALAASLERPIETDDLSGAVVRLAGGGLMTVVSSSVSPAQESRLRLDFRDVTVELVHLYTYGNAHWRVTAREGADPEVLQQFDCGVPDPVTQHAALLVAVLDARGNGTSPPCSGAQGRAALELVTGIYASALTGAVVRPGQLVPGHPFYERLDGGLHPWPLSPTATGAGR
jgi:predicted dehydrogenase